ncbi:MAG: GHMP kinase [Chloroflexi bacterium]|nr:GHMP kinase [Chloroflexota bacterium]
MIRKSSAVAPGTCGELAQGMLDGVSFLVTFPIDLYATATVELRDGTGIVVASQASPKARHAVELTMAYLGAVEADVTLYVESSLPRGKGMGSSTADVAASIVATADALGAPLTPRQIAEIALLVEPSDGVMFPGIALFDHRDGKIVELLGDPPPMRVAVLDFGGSIDTVAFNRSHMKGVLSRLEPEMVEAVELIRQGIRQSDIRLIGAGSTISARANQAILPKPQLERVIELASEVGASGVNVAHSGTVIGLLFDDDHQRVQYAESLAWERFPGLKAVQSQRIIGGGVAATATREVIRI